MIGVAGDPGSVDLLYRSARGDPEAQYMLVEHVLTLARGGQAPMPRALVVAEAFARMAASHGSLRDTFLLSLVLDLLGNLAQEEGRTNDAICYHAECIALLNELADAGCAEAEGILAAGGEGVDPRSFELARAITTSAPINPTSDTIH